MATYAARFWFRRGISGLVGTLTYAVKSSLGTHLGPTSAGIAADTDDAGLYYIDVTVDTAAWDGNAWIEWKHGTQKWTETVFVGASVGKVNGLPVLPANIPSVTPFQATTANPRFGVRKQPAIAQGSEPTDVFTITDAQDNPVNLAGKLVRMVYWLITDDMDDDTPLDDEIEGAFKYETGGGGITIGGASNNQVTVQHDELKTDTAGSFGFALWNVTDKLVLLMGTQPIRPALVDVA